MPTLYILCGPSACGKTTWAMHYMEEHASEDIRYVSRDEIRYSLLQPDDDYFSREKEVFREFAGTITQTLVDGFDCIADATHLNEFSRRKLTQAIDMHFTDYEIVYVVVSLGYDECIKRNAAREGRACAPEAAIARMFRNFTFPSLDEDERAREVLEVTV